MKSNSETFVEKIKANLFKYIFTKILLHTK